VALTKKSEFAEIVIRWFNITILDRNNIFDKSGAYLNNEFSLI
jgi:hypothetical protein